ncbi:MAG TPA: prolipoprotein diacylglyceryl transferase, partial [Aliarcobacter sp.]|nr:prolipoprotein diacylglyceryl transferase [Aliarcobacter sp.]
VFLILVYFRNRKKFDGQLALMYGIFYTIARIIAEFYREPDPQIGFIAGNWLTMGILQSGAILLICLTIFAIKSKKITA